MIVSSELRKWDETQWTFTGSGDGIDYIAIPRNALALIADVVEAAETLPTNFVVFERLQDSLSALRDALKVQS